mgnify:CR=1 FL=1
MIKAAVVSLFLLFLSQSQAQVNGVWNDSQLQARERQIFQQARQMLIERLKAKQLPTDLMLQGFKMAQDKSLKNCGDGYAPYRATLYWRGVGTPLQRARFEACATDDLSKDDKVVGLIPDSYEVLNKTVEEFTVQPFKEYQSANEDHNADVVYQACLAPGFTVYGWDQPRIETQNKHNNVPKSFLIDGGVRDEKNKNCINIRYHLEGNGSDVVFGRKVSNRGGASLGFTFKVYGAKFQNPNTPEFKLD